MRRLASLTAIGGMALATFACTDLRMGSTSTGGHEASTSGNPPESTQNTGGMSSSSASSTHSSPPASSSSSSSSTSSSSGIPNNNFSCTTDNSKATIQACNSETSGEWPSWPPPPDAPTFSQYAINADATITDTVTGLTWARNESPKSYNWEDAKAYCSCLSLGGNTDFRLPTVMELISILDLGVSSEELLQNGAVNASAFPNNSGAWTWTASPYRAYGDTGAAPWAIWFGTGQVTEYGEGASGTCYTTPVRCVRGPKGNTTAPAYVVANGTVYDPVSKLTWQQAISDAKVGPTDAAAYCTGLTLAGATWRLPGVKELETLVDRSVSGTVQSKGTALPNVFQVPSGVQPSFWASAPLSGGNAWFVTSGAGDAMYGLGTRQVLCVH